VDVLSHDPAERRFWEAVRQDVAAVLARDPAARSHGEVWLAYPGFHALLAHRVARRLWRREHTLVARVLSHAARGMTGIEIHPGADVGVGVFIDHGMGVVIGETSVVGDHCTLYHGVTLGGTSWKAEKRHPTLGVGVVVGAGAKLLGPIEVGDGAKIGANSVVVRDVPPDATVVGIPGRMAAATGAPEPPPGRYWRPDPTVAAQDVVAERLIALEAEVRALKGLPPLAAGDEEPMVRGAAPREGAPSKRGAGLGLLRAIKPTGTSEGD